MKVTKREKEQVNKRFSENALKMMKKRYLLPFDDGGQESPADLFERVANALAAAEETYGRDKKFIDQVASDFFDIMASKQYTPGGRTLTNAGGETPIISNCVVLPIRDSMDSIFQTLKDAALLQQAGCGLGFDLSEMRPADEPTKKSRGRASGPVSFLKVYDTAFGTIKQQGRHGANMAIMRVDHPDILDFMSCKKREGEIRNFNITVAVTDEFMTQLEEAPESQWYCHFKGKKVKPHNVLRHPNGSVYGSEEIDLTVRDLFDKLVEGAWKNGEPGIAFIDFINRTNPLPGLGNIAAPNPCGEQFLHPYDNCNLGSINLAEIVKDGDVDWDRLRFVTRTATRLMDNVIDLFDFPISALNDMARANRRIGLGIMGFGDLLYQMGIGYNTKEGMAMASKVMGFVQKESHKMSRELAKEKKPFPNMDKSVFAKQNIKMRNAALTTVAPTGSISMMMDTSSGMEPNFALSFVKQDKDGEQYTYLNRHLQKAIDDLKLSSEKKKEIMDKIVKTGTLKGIDELPESMRKTFVTAMEITGEDHIKMQAAFQKHTDNSISKTINLPNEATREDVAESFAMAWRLGCKSCTVYRDGSRKIQILNIDKDKIVSTTESVKDEDKAKDQQKGMVIGEKEIANLPIDITRLAPRKRPDVVVGKTYRIRTGYGTLYVTINDDEDGVPFEVFASMGKSGGFFQEQSEAICRLISLSLRSGVKIEEIISNIKGIRGPEPIFTDKGLVLSLPDAIGKILTEHVTGVKEVESVLSRPKGQESLPFPGLEKPSIADSGFMPGCPECGSQLTMSEGCISCKNCGFSRCS